MLRQDDKERRPMAGCESAMAELAVPAYGGQLAPLPTARRRAFAAHLRTIIAEAFANPAPRVRAALPRPVPLAATEAACATCRGQCCSHGGEHAYLDEDTIRRVARTWPELGPRGIAARYRARVAKESFAGSCVFHGARGCRLSRELRSDLCNEFYCNALKLFIREHGTEIPARLRILAKSAEGVQRSVIVEVRNRL
jgi:hypothetical protein